MTVIVYGASDDLVEVDGDIREEFNPPYDSDEASLLGFSDGTILRIHYTESGIWRITTVRAGLATLHIEQAPEGDDNKYTDRAELTGDVQWVVFGSAYATAKVKSQ